jgi:DNA-binding MarR family transcriptional regulator
MVTRKTPSRHRTPDAARTQAQTEAAMLQLDNQLCFALYSASLAMTKLYKPLLDDMGLTYPQYLTMLVLWERDRLTVTELGERLYLDSGTLTPLLKRMEAAGLIHRARAADDERRVVISLTAAGLKLREGAAAVPRHIACATQCSLDEIAELRQRLHTLRQRLTVQPVARSPAREAA